MSSKEDVFKAIESEINYQDALWGYPRPHTITEWLAYILDYANEAMHIRCRKSDSDQQAVEETLHTVRKIAALATRCMEHHGALTRVLHIPDVDSARKAHGVKIPTEKMDKQESES